MTPSADVCRIIAKKQSHNLFCVLASSSKNIWHDIENTPDGEPSGSFAEDIMKLGSDKQ